MWPVIVIYCLVSLALFSLVPNLYFFACHVFNWAKNQLATIDYFTRRNKNFMPEFRNRALAHEDIPEFALDNSEQILPRFAADSMPKYKENEGVVSFLARMMSGN